MNQKQIGRRETSITSRTTLTGRQTAGRATISGRPQAKIDKAVDSRNSRDLALIQTSAQRVHDFLLDINYENVPSVKQLQEGIALKPFLDMIIRLNDIMSTQIKPVGSDSKDYQAIYTFISTISGQLAYPETNMIKMQELKSCSQSVTWRKFLLFLVWLVELCDFVIHVDMEGDAENPENQIPRQTDTNQFIKQLCQSDDPQSLLQGPQYFDFVSQMYNEYINNNDQQLSQIECLFDIWREQTQVQEQKLSQEVKKIDQDTARQRKVLEQEIEAAKLELQFAFDYDQRFNLNINVANSVLHSSNIIGDGSQELPTAQQLVEIKMHNLEKLQTAIQILGQQIEELEINTIPQLSMKKDVVMKEIDDQQKQQKEIIEQLGKIGQQVGGQEITYSEFQKLQFQHSVLKQELTNLEIQLNEGNAQIQAREGKKSAVQKEIQKIALQAGLAPEDAGEKQLQQKCQLLRQEAAALEKESNQLNQELHLLSAERDTLQNSLREKEDQLDAAQRRAEVFREDHERHLSEVKLKNQQQVDKLQQLQDEVRRLSDQKKKLQQEVEEQATTNQQQTVQRQREIVKANAEQQKIEAIVGNILLQINQSREKARDQLDLVRDKVGEALKAIQGV